jgi:hypothetical protein
MTPLPRISAEGLAAMSLETDNNPNSHHAGSSSHGNSVFKAL